MELTFRGGPLFPDGLVGSNIDLSNCPMDHSDPFSIPVPLCSVFSMCNVEEKLIIAASGLLTADRGYSYMRSYVDPFCSCFASQVYVLAIKNIIFPQRIWNVLFVIRKWCLNSYGK